jgi:hydroxymethylpyrimidine/phosphomethylpyrimidine kinase
MTSSVLSSIPVALSIAGSDSGGHAGIQADLMTFAAHQVYGTTAITATTAQNPHGIRSFTAVSPEHLREQIEQVLDYFPVMAIKIGMLANTELVQTVAEVLSERRSSLPPVILDPVMVSSSGSLLLSQEAIHALTHQLLPLANLVTPNLDEAGVLLGKPILSRQELMEGVQNLAKRWQNHFLLKGGHLREHELVDAYHSPTGETQIWRTVHIPDIDTHGSGCTLSSAIAANLARGFSLIQSIGQAHQYLQRAMKHPLYLKGTPFINHFPPG